MSLTLQIQQQLSHLHSQGGQGLLSLNLPEGLLEADFTAIDTIGCAFESLSLNSSKLATATLDELKKLSVQLTAKLSYLLEPISLIEADAHSSTVQLRSSPPQQGEDGRSYYELVVAKGGHLRLCRFFKATGQPRQIIPAQVTRQVFARLGEDFTAVMR